MTREEIQTVQDNENEITEDVYVQANLVPHWGILVVSIFSIFLLVFPFSFLVSCDSILIIIAMFQDCLFYMVAKHGKYGFMRNNEITDDIFVIRGGWAVSILVMSLPFAVGVMLMYFEGGQLTLYWVIGMAIMLTFTGLDIAVR